MTFTTEIPASVPQPRSKVVVRSALARPDEWLERIAEADLALVHRLASATRFMSVKQFAIIISKLGNGWIYLIIMALVIREERQEALFIILISTLNAALSHVVYPVLKRRFRRRRPFQVDPHLPSLLQTLDEYSFPSGHVMTLSGVLLPVYLLIPEARIPALGLILAMAWSRIATAHHFPGDVLAGALLGIAIALPFTYLMLQLVAP